MIRLNYFIQLNNFVKFSIRLRVAMALDLVPVRLDRVAYLRSVLASLPHRTADSVSVQVKDQPSPTCFMDSKPMDMAKALVLENNFSST